MHMPELFRDILHGDDGLASPTSTLQEETAHNSGSPVTAPMHARARSIPHGLQSLQSSNAGASVDSQGQPTPLRTGARGVPIPGAWIPVATLYPEGRRPTSDSPPPLVVAAQAQPLHVPRVVRPMPSRLQERLQGPSDPVAETQLRSRSPPRRRLTPTPSARTTERDREPVEVVGWRSGSEQVQARLPALLSWMQAGGTVVNRRSSRGRLQAFVARNQDNAAPGQIMSPSQ